MATLARDRKTASETSPGASFVPGCYPVDLTVAFQVSTGASLVLRPIRSEDAEKLVAFHSHLSFDSIYRRYFSLHPLLSDEEVRHYTQVDYVDRFAFVIEEREELVAVGRYDRYPDSHDAEVAFLVRDDYQHLGLGHRLLDALAKAAWARGITTLCAETLSVNLDMIAVFRHAGFPFTATSEFGEVSVRLAIEPT